MSQNKKKKMNIHSKSKDNFEDLFELQYNNKFAKEKHERKKYFKNKSKKPPYEDDNII